MSISKPASNGMTSCSGKAMYQRDLLRMGDPRTADAGRKMFSSGMTGHVSDVLLYLQEILDHMCCLRPSFTRPL